MTEPQPWTEPPAETAWDAVPPGYGQPQPPPAAPGYGPDFPAFGQAVEAFGQPLPAAPPEPPPGPGVQPPFVAPPTQRDKGRMWAGIGIGAAALVLCGVGSVAGCVGLGFWLDSEQKSESQDAVQRYLGPLVRGEYGKAYLEQCSELRELETAEQYTARVSARAKLTGYSIISSEQAPDSGPTALVQLVRVQLQYDSGPQSGQFRVIHDQADKRYEVCGGDN
ncbi:hypothetical protein Lfu02_67210 [Longispora fulva]|uniref:DUF4878 domain-containing protein n=1 Tax=Longispora fulva TaxID=619741 RepID=A0A8J7KLY9_9ACTN|nr:hypothetical protein [Longispora fulva]MBG6138546.1 hypothetical protein [Longispora fulva]GIG62349.1 hypothetical protein Lfu02_67210 [Longispora fulva]